jgi:hypothetical protein
VPAINIHTPFLTEVAVAYACVSQINRMPSGADRHQIREWKRKAVADEIRREQIDLHEVLPLRRMLEQIAQQHHLPRVLRQVDHRRARRDPEQRPAIQHGDDKKHAWQNPGEPTGVRQQRAS